MQQTTYLLFASFLLLILLISACGAKKAQKSQVQNENQQSIENPKTKTQAQIDDEKIVQYLSDNKIKAEKTSSGLYYTIAETGEGASPTLSSAVTVHYKGTLLNGAEFDSSYKRGIPATFPLGGVIKGWQEGIPLLSKGGKGTLYIPSGLAYGPRSMGAKLPANSVLIFDVELIDIK